MRDRSQLKLRADDPPVEREYIEIYPVDWSPVGWDDVRAILGGRSHPGLDEITVYLHIPFCPELCSWCGFNKTAFRESVYEDYISALVTEIEYYRDHPDIEGRRVTAVYVGGGTGSMLLPSELERILTVIRLVFPLVDGCEVTVESHPNTLSVDKLQGYAALGVNRLSIGTQSFSDRKLQAIGRSNTAATNEQVILDARAVGIDKLSIDLMYRVPNETIAELEHDLAKVRELDPTNVSCYSLIVEGTPFERALPSLPDIDRESQMFSLIRETLTGVGYSHWSLADFCHPGGMTQYNLNYWRAPQTLLIGLGAGAHTHYFGGHTWSNDYSVKRYIGAIEGGRFPGIAGQPVSTDEIMRKYLVLGVHCLSVDTAPFRDLFGVELREAFVDELESLSDVGWITVADGRIEVTPLGEFYINNIAQRFYSDACRGKVQPWSMGLRSMRTVEHVPMPADV